MKKVVSALTAAAMCASMAAGAASVFAAYEAKDMAYSLRVVEAGKGTVSADGSTITFASAADAANATFLVGQYLECDPANVAIQQIGGCVSVSDPAVNLSDADGNVASVSLADTDAYYSEAKSYTSAAGVSFSTNAFVNCFGYTNKLKKYKSNAMVQQWGSSKNWPAEWGYADKNEHIIWTWACGLEDDKTTAKFISEKSDEFPLMAFNVSLDADVKDGTYTIDWEETYVNEYGTAEASYFTAGKDMIIPATLKSLTIVVGEGGTEPTTTTAPKDTTTAPKDTTTAPKDTATTPKVTETTAKDDNPGVGSDAFVWDIADAKAEEGVAYIDVTVQNDPGSNAYGFQILIEKDGKWMSFAEAGMEVADIAKGTAYDRMSMFAANLDEGSAAASNDTDVNPQYAVDGKPVVTFGVLVPDDFPEGVYNLKFQDLKVAAADGKTMLSPTATQGTLTIGDVVTTPVATTTAPKDTTTTPKTTTTKAPDTTTAVKDTTTTAKQPGDYLYGDVNKNGKVELVDIVMLNRNLTGYGDQKLDDYQTEVADCWDDAKLDGKDSMEILKYLIGLNKTLPTAAK